MLLQFKFLSGKHRPKTSPITTVVLDDIAASAAPTTPSKSEDSTTANVLVVGH